MPPKKNIKQKSFALIWWISTGEKDIIPVSQLPKTRRKVENVVSLKWHDKKTGTDKIDKAKIIEFHDDEQYLDNISLDNAGNKLDPQAKLFLQPVLEKKNTLQNEKQKSSLSKKTEKLNFEHHIEKTKPFLPSDFMQQSISNPQNSAIGNLNSTNIIKSIRSTKTNDDSTDVDKDLSNYTVIDLSVKNTSTNRPLEVSNHTTYVSSSIINETNSNIHVNHEPCSVATMIDDDENQSMNLSLNRSVNNEDLDEGTNNEEINNLNVGAIHTFLPAEVTEENITFLRQILAGLEKACCYQQKFSDNPPEDFEFSNEYKTYREGKREIAPNCAIYLPISKIDEIENNAKTKDNKMNWKKILRQTLEEMYGTSIANFTTGGRAGDNNRQAIDKNVSQGIFAWILSKTTETVSFKNYVHEINKIAYNTRNKNQANYYKSKGHTAVDEVTERNLQFLRKIIAAAEKEKAWHTQSNLKLSKLNSALIPDSYIKPSSNKERIAEEYNIFFPKAMIAYIEKNSEIFDDPDFCNWRKLVKAALIDVYGKNIKNYSAKGTIGDRPHIDHQLFNAVYAWANRRSKNKIPVEDYVEHINKIASNKRKSEVMNVHKTTGVKERKLDSSNKENDSSEKVPSQNIHRSTLHHTTTNSAQPAEDHFTEAANPVTNVLKDNNLEQVPGRDINSSTLHYTKNNSGQPCEKHFTEVANQITDVLNLSNYEYLNYRQESYNLTSTIDSNTEVVPPLQYYNYDERYYTNIEDGKTMYMDL